jgi:sulfate permease, SulP family
VTAESAAGAPAVARVRRALNGLRELAPRRSDYAGLGRSWPRDLAAGVTVAVVALPLALAFGVATGVGAAPGLVTAVIAGAVTAILGGSNLQVSGPTGAMTVVLVPLVAQHGPSVVYPLAVMAGLIVVLAAVLRLGRLLGYVPWPLIEGFTLGIAIVIAAQQVPNALGVAMPHVENAAYGAMLAAGEFLRHPQWAAVALLLLAVFLTAGLTRLHRAVPASLIAVVVVTVVAEIGGLDVAVIGNLPSSLPAPSLPDFAGFWSLLGPAAAVAFLAALESLLSARVADGMTDAGRNDPDRELFGQGMGNIASGLFGGLPSTGAIARTAVNARAGARTRVAALTHALVLAVLIYTASGLVGRIPLVALAGVLLVTAYRMVERHAVRSVLRSTPGDALVFVVTAVATVALDLVLAVGIGMALAVVVAVVRMAGTARAVPEPLNGIELDDDAEQELLHRHVLAYRLDGPLFFGAVVRFVSEVTATADVRVVVLRLGALALLDASGARALGEIVDVLESRGITVLVKGASDEHRRLLAAVGTLRPLLDRGHVFDDLTEAVAHALDHVAGASAVVPAR